MPTTVCRLCKTKDTPQSQHLTACATSAPAPVPPTQASVPPRTTLAPTLPHLTTGESCSVVVSPGDASVGIATTTDASCKTSGGVGCFGPTSVCRFCKTKSTPQSQHLIECGAFASAPTITSAPAPVPPPTTAPLAPVQTLAPPTPAPTISEVPVGGTLSIAACSQVVSPGDASVGIAIVSDASCATGGLGCLDSVCRFCRVRDTPQSRTYISCGSFSDAPPSTAATAAPTPSSVVLAPVTTPPSPQPAPVAPPPVSGQGVLVRTPPTDSCSTALITPTLASAGIWAVVDPACPRDNDTGDCSEFCRMCKFADTSVSSRFQTCSSVLAAVAAAASPSSVELAPPPTPPANACSPMVSLDSVSRGVWMKLVCVTPSSASTGACVETRCDYCKYFESSASAEYPPCDDPVAIDSATMVLSFAASDASTTRLSAPEYATLLAAAVGVAAVVLLAAVAIAHTVEAVLAPRDAELSVLS